MSLASALHLDRPPVQIEAAALLLLVGGFIFGRLNAEQTRRMPAWTRLGCSALLVVAAYLWWVECSLLDFREIVVGVTVVELHHAIELPN